MEWAENEEFRWKTGFSPQNRPPASLKPGAKRGKYLFAKSRSHARPPRAGLEIAKNSGWKRARII